MIEGKLIKFYREELELTQGQLVKGICSVTHLSKIERNITEYSHDIIDLLAEKMGIIMEDERSRYYLLQEKLADWNNSIIMNDSNEIHRLKSEIEKDSLRNLADFNMQYHLLLARYYIFLKDYPKAKKNLAIIKARYYSLNDYEKNLYRHVDGIYLFGIGSYNSCLETLKKIDENYPNLEYNYHLAVAYFLINSDIKAYYYGQKALKYFQKTLNLIRIVDIENIILTLLHLKEPNSMDEIKQQYEKLLNVCKSINAVERESIIYGNLAFEYFRRKRYVEAKQAYERALEIAKEGDADYYRVLDGYISSCYEGKFLSKAELINLSIKGLELAQQNKYLRGQIYFEMQLQKIRQNEKGFYQYIEKKALPFFSACGDQIMKQHYEKKLFLYYMKSNQQEKAFLLSSDKMMSEISYIDFE
ncbi:transcriptional regulator [Sporosarcina sp. NPDC096371]|uniref:helix-turn-helix domain-containing protein n=1 Tax=Sporosarcina sp. NPDC096371 TaxID=3364530 RepID=UPI00381CDF81